MNTHHQCTYAADTLNCRVEFVVRCHERINERAIAYAREQLLPSTRFQFSTLIGDRPPLLLVDVGPWVAIPQQGEQDV